MTLGGKLSANNENSVCLDKLQFQPGGFFFDMINTYNVSVSGLLLYHPHFREPLNVLDAKKRGRLVGLGSREHLALEIRHTEIIDHLSRGSINLGKVTDRLAFMLANIAHSSVEHLLKPDNPLHEFFRHFRNGASHGGRWSFKNNEPRRHAEWRGRRVTKELQDQSLWDLNMGPGDVIALLWDIENDLLSKKV